ncbi:preprotein translocase subunit YajC [Saccharopolyspora sp. NFXS83]|uniref:preprotein translocase subunit YajC n=1 Tax=Saccharopolyspora sp. NFXS83 TaxID=2993560 RepID=UPI00224B542A|nr:preprotein translocase subunit YajC [Saccharopolyspora sp. NFXS83]MCX2732327.1 preprotein translocase subunit YajC [Saccharopolyspora sp. NFXS83]
MSLESLFLPLLIVLLAVPMFLQARKQKRAMQEQQKLQNSLEAGDRVMTTSGLFGTVVSSTDDSIDLEIAPGVVTTWVRAAVREKVVTDAEDTAIAEDAETEQDAAPAAAETEVKDEKDTTEVPTSQSTAEVAEPIEKQKTS